MLLLFVLVDDFIAHATLGGVAVALYCVGHRLRPRNQLLAVGAFEVFDMGFIGFPVDQLFFSAKYILVLSSESSLLFNFLRVYFLQLCWSVTSDSPTLTFRL
jgi:hypothetical protein